MSAAQENIWKSIWLIWIKWVWVTTTYRRLQIQQITVGIPSPSKTDLSTQLSIHSKTTPMMMEGSKMLDKALALLEITLTFTNEGNTVMSMISQASEILLSCLRLHEEHKKCLLNLKLKPLLLSGQTKTCKIRIKKRLTASKEAFKNNNRKIYHSQTWWINSLLKNLQMKTLSTSIYIGHAPIQVHKTLFSHRTSLLTREVMSTPMKIWTWSFKRRSFQMQR